MPPMGIPNNPIIPPPAPAISVGPPYADPMPPIASTPSVPPNLLPPFGYNAVPGAPPQYNNHVSLLIKFFENFINTFCKQRVT